MKALTAISPRRILAIGIKEFIQIWRDRPTFGMIFLMPLMQLVLFGFAINADPKHLPTAIIDTNPSTYSRSLTAAMQNTHYFKITEFPETREKAEHLLARGEVNFVITIPENFSRDLLRGEKPLLLIEADASDPMAIGNAMRALTQIGQTALTRDLQSLPALAPRDPPFEIRAHNRYNPEGLTSYNIVPGLLAVLLNMTLVAMTAVAMTREKERGTLESLLATPVRPFEVMVGKLLPFVMIAYVQIALILIASWFLFNVPVQGNVFMLSGALSLYIAANLAIGFTISTFSGNQLQAMQMSFFYFLPSMLLSGFMFPFQGMPTWAQFIGDIFPITHALRIIRGVILKGNGWSDISPEVWPMLLFLFVISLVAMKRYRQTLD